MPNYTRTKIYGTKKQIKELFDKIGSYNESNTPVIDFNKLIPMPEDVKNTKADGFNDDGFVYFLYENPYIDTSFFARSDLDDINPERGHRIANRYSTEELNQLRKAGEKQYDNLKNYGARHWYDWSYRNWGTKWNAMEAEVNFDDEHPYISFDTAWCAPAPIIELINLPAECAYEGGFAEVYDPENGWTDYEPDTEDANDILKEVYSTRQ